jgi:hypothetical protein
MSSFYYNPRRVNDHEPRLAVRCDYCSNVLWTDVEGQCFPQHITVDAKEAGWLHLKSGSKWVDICPECSAYKRQKERERTIGGAAGCV